MEIEQGLKKHGDLHHITLDNGERLIEFFEDKHGKTREHLSRGGPIKKPALNQVQIDRIARVADLLRSNTNMKNMVMKTVYQYALSHFK